MRLAQIVGLIASAYLVHAILVGVGDRLEQDTLAARVLLSSSAPDQAMSNHVDTNRNTTDTNIFDAMFGATVKMGIKRRSNMIGQIYDFLRLSGVILF